MRAITGPAGGRTPRPKHRTKALALAALMSGALGGCVSNRGDVTGSIAPAAAVQTSTGKADLQRSIALLEQRYQADPANRDNAVDYARALRGLDRNAQAVAVLENIAIKNPGDRQVLAAYGKALADVGRAKEAADVLARAHTPDQPDYTILSAQGSAADQLGDHEAAQNYYTAALKIAPDNPHVLSNLGLSYALSKQLPLAERTLRTAADAPGAGMRVRQNLALVLALESKFKDAETVARRDQQPAEAAANVAAIRDMIANSPTWQGVRKPPGKTTVAGTATAGL